MQDVDRALFEDGQAPAQAYAIPDQGQRGISAERGPVPCRDRSRPPGSDDRDRHQRDGDRQPGQPHPSQRAGARQQRIGHADDASFAGEQPLHRRVAHREAQAGQTGKEGRNHEIADVIESVFHCGDRSRGRQAARCPGRAECRTRVKIAAARVRRGAPPAGDQTGAAASTRAIVCADWRSAGTMSEASRVAGASAGDVEIPSDRRRADERPAIGTAIEIWLLSG